MIKVQNLSTSEVINVLNVVVENGQIISEARRPHKGARFYSSYPMMVAAGESEDGRDLHTLAEGWVLASRGAKGTGEKKERKPRQPKQESVSEPATPATSAQEPQPKTTLELFAEFKTKHPDTILLFRRGDFYEAYSDDAVTVSDVCCITLTIHNGNGNGMVGFPYHALDTYLPKLIRAGHRVAICDGNGEPLIQEPAINPQVEEVVEEVTEQAKAENVTAEKVWQRLEQETNKTKREVLGSAAEIASEFVDPEMIRQELAAKYGSMGADMFEAVMKIAGIVKPAVVAQPQEATVNEEQVRGICEEYFANVKRECRVIEVKSAAGVAKLEGTFNKDFDIFCNLVGAGKPLYMYGPAGSGKSYTAKQIAEALKLDYHETSQAMFAHELKGYGDAKGEFVETAFYRAFANGGVFFLDEVDASAPEALVVLNNAIANKRFDFPVIGNVNAHENFRVVAAGNTRMTGATLEYTARQMQDTSFKNRFFFATVTYDRSVFLSIAGGDEEIVNFGEDLRRAARTTGISQLFSYRQASDLATLQACCNNNDAYLLRGSVLQEKTVDDALNLYEHLNNKANRWAKAMKVCIEQMRTEEVW